ncbi:hypothetical protein DRP53_02695 [candidate division WOR-3 bacterium]|uniref:Radical SAM protein n=1 Tax=candidate division WOR-3 bacterium TaxID=2052148 RepID=A0A660SM63_UNCW3|nr:MAG: hypothetical protein DRP53_02695 [candidate division WOR-3 bacterium]
MRIRYLAVFPSWARKQKRRPYKGSIFFRRPDYDYLRLKAMIPELEYLDERVEPFYYRDADLVLLKVLPHLLTRASEVSLLYRKNDIPVVFFGPLATVGPEFCLRFSDAVVVGDITASIGQIVGDLKKAKLRKIYRARGRISFDVDREMEEHAGFVPDYSQLRLFFGCGCERFKELCPEHYLYPRPLFCNRKEAIRLVGEITRKRIILLDDGIDYNPQYYIQLFKDCWHLHKEWIVTATGRIFDHPDLLLAMKRGGVRVVIIKPDYFHSHPYEEMRRDLSRIHQLKMIPGVMVMLLPDLSPNVIETVMRLPADFALFPTLTPLPFTPSFPQDRIDITDLDFYDQGHPVLKGYQGGLIELIKDRYYSWDRIWLRLANSISSIGIYNAFTYLLPINLALRQNFLEGIPYPP